MVRAIDAQQAILQSGIAEKIQQVQQQNPDIQQRHSALQLSEQDRLSKEQVKESEESEKTAMKEKEKRESGGKNKEQHSKETLAAIEDGEFEGEGEHINIKV